MTRLPLLTCWTETQNPSRRGNPGGAIFARGLGNPFSEYAQVVNERQHFNLEVARMPTCEDCECELDGTEVTTVEAYETTGLILCDECFAALCEQTETP